MSSTRRDNQGVSLAETLIASSLMVLLVGLMYTAVASGIRYQRRSDALIDLDQSAALTVAFLTRELLDTNLRTIVPFGPSDIAFSVPKDPSGKPLVNSAGQFLWDKVICYRLETLADGKRLVRQEEQVGGANLQPLNLYRLTPPRTSAYFAASTIPIRVLSNQIADVRFTLPTSAARPIEVTLDFETKADGHTYGLKVSSKVNPRN